LMTSKRLERTGFQLPIFHVTAHPPAHFLYVPDVVEQVGYGGL